MKKSFHKKTVLVCGGHDWRDEKKKNTNEGGEEKLIHPTPKSETRRIANHAKNGGRAHVQGKNATGLMGRNGAEGEGGGGSQTKKTWGVGNARQKPYIGI